MNYFFAGLFSTFSGIWEQEKRDYVVQGCTGNGTERILADFLGTTRIFRTGTDYFKERNGMDRNGFFDGMERNGFSETDFLAK